MSTDLDDDLQRAREVLVKARREIARKIVFQGEKGLLTQMPEIAKSFVDFQVAIEAVDRALKHQAGKASAGSP